MTEIGLGAAMNDSVINDLNKEIDWMTEEKKIRYYTDLKLFFLSKHYLEIEIEKRKMQLKIEKIKIEIDKFHELRITMVNEASQISELVALVEEKMNEILCKNNHTRVDLMNEELKSSVEKLYLLEPEIRKMEVWIYDTKMRKMRIKDITITATDEVIQFSDEKSPDDERETYEYNHEIKASAYGKSIYIVSFNMELKDEGEREQRKANGLNYAINPKIHERSVMQYWHLKSQPCRVMNQKQKETHIGVNLTLELPKSSSVFEWCLDGATWRVDQWPLTVQIYSLKLTPCRSDDQEDYSVVVSGDITLRGHESGSYSCSRVKRQTLTKKDSNLLLNDPIFMPLPRSSCPTTIHAKLVLRGGSDEPDKLFTLSDEVEFDFHGHATRSKEVVDEVYMSGKEFSEGTSALSKHVNLGTGKQYMLRLTHGIVVNTIVANIVVHLNPSFFDSLGGKCKIIASDKQNQFMSVVVLNSKKVPLTFDDDKGWLQLLRRRICVDFFSTLRFYIKCFGTCADLEFNPRDCYRHDNCEHKVALGGIKVEVEWSENFS